jgi:methylenetetrahydrofolate dehydrogenase (NADP+)/methenyltetrahydrofolate cyclohydrolase
MAHTIIDGKKIAAEIQLELADRIAALREAGAPPGLAVVLVGENPASVSYVTAKERDCEKVGIVSFDHRLPVETSEEELLALVARLNADPAGQRNSCAASVARPDRRRSGAAGNSS